MNTLYFEKISQFDRAAEPVTVSVPFAPGRLSHPAAFVIRDGERVLPTQNRPLGHWPDGSVKWLLVHFQPDLPGNADKTLHFAIAANPSGAAPEQPVTVTPVAGGLKVDTGPLQFVVPSEGFRPITGVVLDGDPLDYDFGGFDLTVSGQTCSTRTGAVSVEIEEDGPLRAVIEIKGRHDGCFNLRGRITAYAGKPYIEIEHQFVHAEDEAEMFMDSLVWRVGRMYPAPTDERHLALGEGYYRTAIQEGQEPLSLLLDTETMLYQANEHFIDSFYGDFWVDDGRLALSIHQAHQNFPKKLHVGGDGIVCSLWPEEAGPVRVLQGMGKTHRMQLHFHPAEMLMQTVSARNLQFQLPDRPALSRDWFRENNPWLEDFFPEKVPGRLISFFNKLHDGRPAALGMFHFGDAPDAAYTDQGRGKGETVWVNNEYDRPHICTLYYGLTGQRRVLDSGIANARHWVDVDFCHYNPDPLVNGGLRIHDVYHATGKVIPSHQWVEGFLDYYFLTGRREALEAGISVAENILRIMDTPAMREPGATAVREGGWALRAMVGMWMGTGDERWKTEARRIVDHFLDWFSSFGGLLAPYTSHSMPRVVFMMSLTVNSLARYLHIEDDERVRALIVATVDDMLEHCIGPDGIFYYKELPSLRRTAPTPHVLEALTYAYRISGDERYLKIAARNFAALLESTDTSSGGPKWVDSSGAVVKGRGGGRVFADRYTSIIIFAGEAARLGLLDWLEYPYWDV